MKKYRRQHNGVTYTIVEDKDSQAVGSVTLGNKKWTLKGTPVIEVTKGSYKHGDEVQIIIWNKAGSTTERARVKYAEDWDRCEIFFPKEVWQAMIKELYKPS